MYIQLDEGRVPGLDDKNVTGSGFELLPVHGPETATFLHELDLVVRTAMAPMSRALIATTRASIVARFLASPMKPSSRAYAAGRITAGARTSTD